MKKLIVLLMALALLFAAGCGGDEPAATPTPEVQGSEAPMESEEPTPEESEDPAPEESEEPAPEESEEPAPEESEEPAPEESEEPAPEESEEPAAPELPAEPEQVPTEPSEPPVETEPPVTEPEEESPPAELPDDPNDPAPVPPEVAMPDPTPLESIMESLLAGVPDLPMLGNTPLDAENFSFFAFIEQPEGAEGLVSEAMIGSIAHSVVLIRLPEGVDASEVAAQMEANADPRKWICVEAEKVIALSRGNLALLIMSNAATADAIAANF